MATSIKALLDAADHERFRHGWLCPDCEKPMLERTNSRSGALFFGCRTYPECTGTRDTAGRETSSPVCSIWPNEDAYDVYNDYIVYDGYMDGW